MRVLADLHIHTALSPCAEAEMTPPAIVECALDNGLGLIAITDHNSAANVQAVYRAGAKRGLFVLPGMELQTREEIHLVCLFSCIESAMAWHMAVLPHLPDQPNRPEYFGTQSIMDEDGNILGEESRLLLNSTDLGVEQAALMVRGLGGICIPAHIDRPSYSLISNLGFLPPGLPVHALEVSWRLGRDEAARRFEGLSNLPVVCSSDAHRLSEIGKGKTELQIEEFTFDSVASSLVLLGGGHASSHFTS